MKIVLAALTLVLVLAGCGGSDDDERQSPSPPASATGPALTIAEALGSGLAGPLLVRGALVVEGDEARLCDALLGSHPPQCGRPSLAVEGLRLADVDGLQEAEGVRWVESVKLLGTVEDGVLTVTSTATG